MKKILSIIAVLAGVVAFTACSSDTENPYAHQSTVTVKSADIAYEASGGTGTIVVESPTAITVTAEAEWVTTNVSDKTITVSVASTNAIEGRSAQIVIKNAAADETKVTIQQKGLVFRLDAKEFSVGDEVSELVVPLTSSVPVTVSSADEWLTGKYDAENNSVIITAGENATGMPRKGIVEVKCGEYTEKIAIVQSDFEKDVLGDYAFYFSQSYEEAQWVGLDAKLTSKKLILDFGDGLTFDVPVTFPNGKQPPYVVRVANQRYLGAYGDYSCYIGFDNLEYGVLENYTSLFFQGFSKNVSEAEVALEEYKGELYFSGMFGGSFLYYDQDQPQQDLGEINTWYILAMTAKSYKEDNLAGALAKMYFPQMEKVSVGGESAASRRVAKRIRANELKFILAPGK